MRNLSTRAAGLLILVMGVWGGLVPFIGPYFHFALGPDKSWTWTSGRLWLSVLPAAAAVLGGLMLLGAGPRPGGKLGALLALVAGIWFAIGPQVSLLWDAASAQGAAHGSTGVRVLEILTYHTLLGSVMAALAEYALPGVVTRKTRAALEADAAAADATPAPSAAEPVTTAQAGPAESDDTGVTRRHPVATHEEQAVVASGSTATAHNGASGRAADETPGGASGAENGYSSGNATQPSTTPTTTAPVTGRRRTGGLLSMLRR